MSETIGYEPGTTTPKAENKKEVIKTEMEYVPIKYDKPTTKEHIKNLLIISLEKNLDFFSSKRIKVILLFLVVMIGILYYSNDYPVLANNLTVILTTLAGVCGSYVGGQSYIDRDKEKERWTP